MLWNVTLYFTKIKYILLKNGVTSDTQKNTEGHSYHNSIVIGLAIF